MKMSINEILSNIGMTRGEEHTSLLFENNIIVSDNNPIFTIEFVKDRAGNNHYKLLNKHIRSARNLFFDVSRTVPKFLLLGNAKTHEYYSMHQACNEIEYDAGSIVADPMFVDFENHNYTLKPESPAFKLGFKPIDMSDVGIIKK